RFLDARRGEIDDRTKLGVARSFQKAAVGQLEDKLVLGMRECAQKGISVRHLVVSGGVASNSFLRERLRACLDAESPDERVELVFPPPHLCTDNAAMIAWAAMDRFLAGDTDPYSIESRPKWSLEALEGQGELSQGRLGLGMTGVANLRLRDGCWVLIQLQQLNARVTLRSRTVPSIADRQALGSVGQLAGCQNEHAEAALHGRIVCLTVFSGFWVLGSGFWVLGSGFWVLGLRHSSDRCFGGSETQTAGTRPQSDEDSRERRRG
ncbi:hypothetical protein K466DRAFT_570969, partial [Polyporus arcularius HHB13444]